MTGRAGALTLTLSLAAVFLAAPAASIGGADPPSKPLSKVPWEGGPAYYKKWASTDRAGWDDPSFFPIGIWFASVLTPEEASQDAHAGINTYFELTGDSRMEVVRDAGLWAIPSNNDRTLRPGPETVASLVTDEADMAYGPGWSGWNGVHGWGNCVPRDSECGYTVSQTLYDRRPTDIPKWSNYGKGVIFWEEDHQAEVFVNRFQEMVAADVYWYTDETVCGGINGPVRIDGTGPMDPYAGKPTLTERECHRAWNYGVTMDRMRQLDGMDGERQPIYAFIEAGTPHDTNDDDDPDNDRTITGPQLQGAVMASLIHEARGVVYFVHNFGGHCWSFNGLRECQAMREPVRKINQRIASLAPVLNTQSLVHDFGRGLDTMLKLHDGSYYIFAMLDEPTGGARRTFTLPAELRVSRAEVLFERRTVSVSGGRFTDSFPDEHSYHVYKLTP